MDDKGIFRFSMNIMRLRSIIIFNDLSVFNRFRIVKNNHRERAEGPNHWPRHPPSSLVKFSFVFIGRTAVD